MSGAGSLGQVVMLANHDRFAVNTDPTIKSIGILAKSYTDGQMPGVYMNGGVYETDVFDGVIGHGDDLKVSTNGKLCAGVQQGELVIARALSCEGGVLKFRLLL
jgi:hypothetical protein